MMRSSGFSLDELIAAATSGNRQALAQCLRWVDDDPELAHKIVQKLPTIETHAHILGITGNPGAGKSTVVDLMIQFLRKQQQKVGVLAIDPTSPYSGGALLGDRIRMQQHTLDENVFIRSLATRGMLGGLSRSTWDSVRVFEAAGYNTILIETVGVGQDEIDIARLAHTTIVVMVPGLGDDVQSLKAGILEIADIFVINKSDHAGVEHLERSLRHLLGLVEEVPWEPPILRTIAAQGQGIDDLFMAIDRHQSFLKTPKGQEKLQAQAIFLFDQLLNKLLVTKGRRQHEESIKEIHARLQQGQADPYREALLLIP